VDSLSDPDVQRLVREERLGEAAELCSVRGDASAASLLFERACAFARASREALRACQPSRALLLAAAAGDEALAREAIESVLADGDRLSASRVAKILESRGHPVVAARLYEALGEMTAAGRAFERGGEAVRAAALFERAGEPAIASAVLEAAARRQPDPYEICIALGELLLRHGRSEAAVRALQKVPEGAPERRAALTVLVPALERLGLSDVSDEAARALTRAGGSVERKAFEPPAVEVKERLYGRYEVVREVASTPSARVFLCQDAVRGERVALKVFAVHDSRGSGRDALARFEREVRALGALQHPNVVPLRDYHPEGPALVLAWMGGGTLERLLSEASRSPSLAPARAVEIACGVLAALGEAHRLGILHRDVKPANVLFDDSGTARLGDFGVAHLEDLSVTATTGWFGTLAYMSPEQREGRPATIESDLFGVGVMLLEMLTGETPGARPWKLPSAAHKNLDARHDTAVLRLVASDPAERPSDAFGARRALESLPWPKEREPRPAATDRDSSIAPNAEPGGGRSSPSTRLEAHGDAEATDTWLQRRIVRLPLTDATLARATAFVRALHPCLQPVLRVDREAGFLWLEAPRGSPATTPLDRGAIEDVRAAVSALHAVGVVHGRIDPAHVTIGDADDATGERQVTVLFSSGVEPDATPEIDRIALARLERAGQF
jgi:serine/threonine-protein kinase